MTNRLALVNGNSMVRCRSPSEVSVVSPRSPVASGILSLKNPGAGVVWRCDIERPTDDCSAALGREAQTGDSRRDGADQPVFLHQRHAPAHNRRGHRNTDRCVELLGCNRRGPPGGGHSSLICQPKGSDSSRNVRPTFTIYDASCGLTVNSEFSS